MTGTDEKLMDLPDIKLEGYEYLFTPELHQISEFFQKRCERPHQTEIGSCARASRVTPPSPPLPAPSARALLPLSSFRTWQGRGGRHVQGQRRHGERRGARGAGGGVGVPRAACAAAVRHLTPHLLCSHLLLTPSAHTFCSHLLLTPSAHTFCSHVLFTLACCSQVRHGDDQASGA